MKYAKKAFELFGDRVKYWMTFNEPIVPVEAQYMYKFHYPLIVDGKKAMQVLYNTALASAKAIEAYGEYKKRTGNNGEIGIILNLTPSYPRSENEEDIKAAEISDAVFNNSFLDPAIKGEFPKLLTDILEKDGVLWESTQEELDIIKKNTVDYLGVNYYQPRRIKARETEFDMSSGWLPDKYFENYDMPGKRMNIYRGWEIYPKAIYDIAKNIQENYGNIKWFISENGMGVEGEERFKNAEGVIEDDYRIEFYREHLTHLHKAITEGANCFGYHTWTPIDCWSWTNAYKNRYGYISVDLPTQIKTVKKSGHWIKEVSESNEIEGWDM